MDYTNNFKTVPVKLNRDELIKVLACLNVCYAGNPEHMHIKHVHDKLREQLDAWDKKQEELKGKG